MLSGAPRTTMNSLRLDVQVLIIQHLDTETLKNVKLALRSWHEGCNAVFFKELFIDITATDKTYETMTANVPTWPFQDARRIVFFTRGEYQLASTARQKTIDTLMFDILEKATKTTTKLEHIVFDLERPLTGRCSSLLKLPSISKWYSRSVESQAHGHRVCIGDGLDAHEVLAARAEGRSELTRVGCTLSHLQYHKEIPGEGRLDFDFGDMFLEMDAFKHGIPRAMNECFPRLQRLILDETTLGLVFDYVRREPLDSIQLFKEQQRFLHRLPKMQSLRQLSIQISGKILSRYMGGSENRYEYDSDEVTTWYADDVCDILRRHHGLDVVFIRLESRHPYRFGAAKRVSGGLFLKHGVLRSDYSRYRFPPGLLDDENIFPDNLVVPEGHPPGTFVYL